MKQSLFFGGIIVAILAMSLPAAAAVPYGYIHGSFQKNEPTGEFGDAVEGSAVGGWGGELHLGLMSDFGAFYFGHRWSDLDDDDDDGNEWKAMNRWILGLRWYLFGSLDSASFTPLLGAGLTMGDAEMERRVDPDDPDNRQTFRSRNDVGWMLEAGAEIRFPSRLSLIGAAQYHRFDADFDSAIFEDPKFKIEYWSFLIGLNIRLGGPSL